MKTKTVAVEKTKTAKVFTDFDGETHEVAFNDFNDLFDSLADLCNDYIADDDIRIELPSGEVFFWNHTSFNYFIKGRLSFYLMVAVMMGGVK